MPEVTVVIMAYNEAPTLQQVVAEHLAVLGSLGTPYEVLIVDDGSSDGTGQLADNLARQAAAVRVLHHAHNQGLGGVYRTGFAQARGALITFFPADGQFPAAIVAEFLRLMPDYDMVLGYLPDRKSPLVGKALSALERWLYRVWFGPMPKFQGVLMFRRAILDELELRSTGRGWAVIMELIIRADRAGYRLASVGTSMRPRISGKSKVNNWRGIWANLTQVAALRDDL